MRFETRHIKGKGRGKFLGFPTINMEIPADLVLEEGVYGVWVSMGKNKYCGAMHFGPIPTFGQKEKQLEVFLLDVTESEANQLNTNSIQITPINYIREIRTFSSKDELIEQIQRDIEVIRRIVSRASAV